MGHVLTSSVGPCRGGPDGLERARAHALPARRLDLQVVTRVLQECYKSVTRALQGCHRRVQSGSRGPSCTCLYRRMCSLQSARADPDPGWMLSDAL
jgi:hypothetical protein